MGMWNQTTSYPSFAVDSLVSFSRGEIPVQTDQTVCIVNASGKARYTH